LNTDVLLFRKTSGRVDKYATQTALVELAQEKANRFNSPNVLDLLLREMVAVPDESIARLLLSAVGND
jgi:hypothetical protein